ncbi:hypothetical protein HYW21_00790 [Candidatus Woesearchaeota archaeon]|nr:hypothetical protein [Candidatus Woesearchaeota archaeon]
MGILDKVAFWKKKDEFADLGLPSDGQNFTDNLALPEQQPDPTSTFDTLPQQPSFPQEAGSFSSSRIRPAVRPEDYALATPPLSESRSYAQPEPQNQHAVEMIGKNIEILSSKMDALRAELSIMNQRLANLERMGYGERETRRRSW